MGNPASIEYVHSQNRHSLQSPRAVLPVIFEKGRPASLLDVGCGTGTWSKTALELGVPEVMGLDGVPIGKEQLLIPDQCFQVQDLTKDWNTGRRFDLALCLEVGEHLEQKFAAQLVRNLTTHSDTIVFSAACPGQAGQHHVNCQWPAFWQKLFNREGFYCDDSLRWKIWDDQRVEPWYRQNLFIAIKDAERAGQEPALRPVVHPEFLYGGNYLTDRDVRFSSMTAIEGGGMTVQWYLQMPLVGLSSKLARKIWKPART